MTKTRTGKTSARQRLIETAERLFYSEGIHTVGIDRIIAEAGVAKMTLYNHFASKDALILEVLKYREEQVNTMFARSIDRHVRKGACRLEAFFSALKDWFKSADFRGCSFINASVELADRSHPAAKFSAGHKERIHQMLTEFVVEAAGDDAAAVAPAVSLLVEGAIVMAQMNSSSKAADIAKKAAMTSSSMTTS